MENRLGNFTTLGIGGPADELIIADSAASLLSELEKIRTSKQRTIILGGGSNTLFMDEGFRGKVIIYKTGEAHWENDLFVAEAGMSFGEMISMLIKSGKKGYEKLVGIPGTVGGAIWNNAGAYGQSVSDYFLKAEIWSKDRGTFILSKNEMEFSYRTSILHKEDAGIAVRAWFGGFSEDSYMSLQDIARETLKTRNEKLPTPGAKTCGSCFQNLDYSKTPPERVHAGRLLEQIGGKTLRVGDAGMYEKHANILMNYGNASSYDVLKLIVMLQKKAKDELGAILIPEIKIVR